MAFRCSVDKHLFLLLNSIATRTDHSSQGQLFQVNDTSTTSTKRHVESIGESGR